MQVPRPQRPASSDRDEAPRVLRTAFLRAVEGLGLSRAAQSRLLGISEASVSRLAHGQRALSPDSKEGELALLFLRLFRSLDALVGGDTTRGRAWFQSPNVHLAGTPAELVQKIPGLVHVLEYVDAIRGKL